MIYYVSCIFVLLLLFEYLWYNKLFKIALENEKIIKN